GPEAGTRLAHICRAEVDAAGGRELARAADAVEPVLAAKARAGRDHQGAPRQLARRRAGERERDGAVARAAELPRLAAEHDLDPSRVDMAGERGRVLAPAFPGPPEQPIIAIGVSARHAAELGRALDDDRPQAVIGEPERAGHAR